MSGILILSVVNLVVLAGCSREHEQWQPYLFRHEGRWVAFNGIAIDHKETKWFATSVGIRKFDGREWTVYDTSNSPLPHNSINTVLVDRKGNVWAGSWYHGVVHFDPNVQGEPAWTVTTKSDGLVDNYVLAIAEDREGNIWFGTFDGASKLDPTTRQGAWTTLRPENSGLTSTTVTAIAVDDSGLIWFGTEPMWIRSEYKGGGVTRYNPYEKSTSAWTTFDTSNSGLPGNSVRTIAFEAAGSAWIGTNKGLSRFNYRGPGAPTWKNFNESSGALPSDVVNAVAFDRADNVWVVTADLGAAEAFKIGGISMFDGSSWKTFTVANSKLQDNRARDLAVDAHGNIWICGFVGVDVYNPQGVVEDK